MRRSGISTSNNFCYIIESDIRPRIRQIVWDFFGNINIFSVYMFVITVIITFIDITFNVFLAELSLLFGTDAFEQYRRGFIVTVLRNEFALNGVLQDRFFEFIVNFTVKFRCLLFKFIIFGNQRLKLFNFGNNSFLFRKRRHGK